MNRRASVSEHEDTSMNDLDDILAQCFEKEWRMVWARAFIKAWLNDPRMQFVSKCSLESLTTHANFWIQRSVDLRQSYPIVSSEDIKEAGFQILGDM
jgi:hypothetical protein